MTGQQVRSGAGSLKPRRARGVKRVVSVQNRDDRPSVNRRGVFASAPNPSMYFGFELRSLGPLKHPIAPTAANA